MIYLESVTCDSKVVQHALFYFVHFFRSTVVSNGYMLALRN